MRVDSVTHLVYYPSSFAGAPAADARHSSVKFLVSFSCPFARKQAADQKKLLVNGLFLVEVAGFEPAEAQMRISTSELFLPSE